MCAIDALGIPAMLGTDATITSTEPVTRTLVTITVHKGHYIWNPGTAVVFASTAAGAGPSAESCCDHMNTFRHPARGRPVRRLGRVDSAGTWHDVLCGRISADEVYIFHADGRGQGRCSRADRLCPFRTRPSETYL
ncbi:organomercurial lyase [Amycolatopsis lurida]